nr:unnamed protein product [Haemonchus contortus]
MRRRPRRENVACCIHLLRLRKWFLLEQKTTHAVKLSSLSMHLQATRKKRWKFSMSLEKLYEKGSYPSRQFRLSECQI